MEWGEGDIEKSGDPLQKGARIDFHPENLFFGLHEEPGSFTNPRRFNLRYCAWPQDKVPYHLVLKHRLIEPDLVFLAHPRRE